MLSYYAMFVIMTPSDFLKIYYFSKPDKNLIYKILVKFTVKLFSPYLQVDRTVTQHPNDSPDTIGTIFLRSDDVMGRDVLNNTELQNKIFYYRQDILFWIKICNGH